MSKTCWKQQNTKNRKMATKDFYMTFSYHHSVTYLQVKVSCAVTCDVIGKLYVCKHWRADVTVVCKVCMCKSVTEEKLTYVCLL